jgi:hypothetical protein
MHLVPDETHVLVGNSAEFGNFVSQGRNIPPSSSDFQARVQHCLVLQADEIRGSGG